MRKFYIYFPIATTVSSQLSWSHYLELIKIDEDPKRNFYIKETINSKWSVRELQRQRDSLLYERLTLSADKEKILELSEKGQILKTSKDLVKDPFVLEFLDIKENTDYLESDLEKNIIEHFWSTEEKAFMNGYCEDGSLDKRISHHAQYWAVLAGLYPERLYDYLYETVIPSIPRYKDNISYEKGYEALAYIKAGRTEEFKQLLDEVWGDWLRQGYSRFPENFMVNADVTQQLMFYGRSYGLSLCHGANGVPPVVLAAYGIFGFSQSDANINEYTLSPNLLHLDWVKGRIPVKEGFISISMNKDGRNEVEIPAGCKVTVNFAGKTQVLKKAGKFSF